MKNVSLVGAGALGSHFALLARNFEIKLRVIDFDRVEAKNVQSQFHTKMGQGKNKAKALQAALQGMFKCPVSAYPTRLMGKNQVELLGHADLIVDCTDNYKARDIIQEHAQEHGIDCLHGCLSADGTLARVVWTEHFNPDQEDVDGDATCEDGEHLPFHVLAAAMIAQVVQKFLDSGLKQSYQMTPYSVVRLT
jgi:molybdopterin/thiamine biosynthesis adenylyltransferase